MSFREFLRLVDALHPAFGVPLAAFLAIVVFISAYEE